MDRVKLWLLIKLIYIVQVAQQGAILAPPWANPKLNPCATQPRGWQLLFWPPDGKCYKIFQLGHPCPEGMELSPSTSKDDKQFSAECRCPPKTAQSASDGKCYELFSVGPCQTGYYFGPDTSYRTNATFKRQWGDCKQMKSCSNSNWLYWPKDEKCHQKFTRGPCPKGQLFTMDNNKFPTCACNKQKELRDFRYEDGQCYQYFTKGPCREKGHLFLPDRRCGCHSFLPHYHQPSGKCYELGTSGPCSKGEIFHINTETRNGFCQCKDGYLRYHNQLCYRPYTQGPCSKGQILVNATTCITQPCERGELYFFEEDRCYRIGSKGPCSEGKVVTFDFDTRPSVDGISYNGVCSCDTKSCKTISSQVQCDKAKGLIRFENGCHKLYTQGMCPIGAWLVPKRQIKKNEGLFRYSGDRDGVCECVPGHLKKTKTVNNRNVTECVSPATILADYLNKNFTNGRVVRI